MKVPENLSYMTPDTVAECIDGISTDTYAELWAVLNNPKFKKRSRGGDGSNGTSEVPDDFSGSLKDAWKLLTELAKANIIEAAKNA